MGTGAFSTMNSGERSVSVQVTDDASAYLQLHPHDTPNGHFADGSAQFSDTDWSGGGNKLALNFTDENQPYFSTLGGGEGVNPGSVYTFDNVFYVMHKGANQDVDIWLTNDIPGVYFYNGDRDKMGGTDPSDVLGPNNRKDISVGGQGLGVGVKIVADQLEVDGLGEITGNAIVHAEAVGQTD
jgi:hypothetical protein